MPSNLLAAFSGAAQGLEQASQNLWNISLAKYKLKQDKEKQDRDFKIQDLQIKNLEEETSPERVALEREALTLKRDSAKIENRTGELAIKAKTQELHDKITESKTTMGLMLKYAPDILSAQPDSQGGISYSPRGSGRTGAIPAIPEGISWEYGGAKFGGEKKKWEPTTKEEAIEFKEAGKPSSWDMRKEARTTVNALVSNNPALQMKAFKDPSLITKMIDDEVMRLEGQYGGGKADTTNDLRSQAIKALQDEGITVNEDTITETIRQIREYEGR